MGPSSSRPVSNVDEKPNKLSELNWGYIDIDFIGKLIESKKYSIGVSNDSKTLLIFSQEPLVSIQSFFNSIQSPIQSRFNCSSEVPGVIQVNRQIGCQSRIGSGNGIMPRLNQIAWGCSSESMLMPDQIPERSKVLDVGSGNGIMARRMRDELKCDVFAIEPGIEASNVGLKDPFEESKIQIGRDKVEKLTVSEAAKQKKYLAAFDVLTVFKSNINRDSTEETIRCLPLFIKPEGVVIIHCVERDRCYYSPNGHVYLVPHLKNHFDNVTVITRNYTDVDGIIICRNPIKLPH